MPRFRQALSVSLGFVKRSVLANPFLAIVCAVFVIVTAILSCTWFRYQINPDATSYFTIAQKYAHFDLRHAINGYWGPMLSWLLVPFIWVHIDPAIGARFVSIAAALGLMLLAYTFLRQRNAGKIIATTSSIILAVMATVWILAGPVTPDLLIAFFTVLFALRLQTFVAKPTRKNGIVLGLVGAAMYFSKGFGFYLFLAVCGLAGCWQLWQSKWQWKRVVARWLPVVIIFAVLALPFVGAITLKYHHLTINNAGTYDHRVFGPVTQGSQPQLTSGPLAPPNNTANTVWEDPTFMTGLLPNWSPLESRANLHYFVFGTFTKNLKLNMQTLYDTGALVTAGALLLVLGCFGKKYRLEYTLFTIIAVIEICGYAMVFTDARYLWSIIVLALLGVALWIAQVERARVLSQLQLLLGAVIITVNIFIPVPHEITSAHRGADTSYQQAMEAAPLIPKGSSVIADNFAEYYPCYYLSLHCYSVLETPASGSETAYYKLLKSTGIQYYINYHTRDSDPRLTQFVAAHFTALPNQNPQNTTTIYQLN